MAVSFDPNRFGGRSFDPARYLAKPTQKTQPATKVAPQGNSGSGFNAPAQESLSDIISRAQPFMEKGPSKSDMRDEQNVINESFAPAIGALDQFQQSITSQLPQQIALQEQQAGGLISSAREEEQRRLGILEQQRGRETARGESALAEARRVGDELLQGLQARFGGTTGTGGFVSEITGREVARNISENRANLENTLSEISSSEETLRRDVTGQIRNIELNLEQAKLQLRQSLANQLREINVQKGEIEARKAEKRLDLMREFRNTQQQIDSRNRQLKQELFVNFESRQQELADMKNRAVQEHRTLLDTLKSAESLNLGITGLDEGFSPGQLDQPVPEGVLLTPGADEDDITSLLEKAAG
jgi:hypothetical protein